MKCVGWKGSDAKFHLYEPPCAKEEGEHSCLAPNGLVYLLDMGAADVVERVCQQHQLHVVTPSSENNHFPSEGSVTCIVISMTNKAADEEVARLVKDWSRQHPVLVVATSTTAKTAFALGKAGALGFLELPHDAPQFVAAIHEAWSLDAVRHPVRRTAYCGTEPFQTLTRRERQVLQGILLGKGNKQLAFDCGISSKTIEYHRANLMQKLRVSSVAELVRVSLEAGFR